MIERHSADGFKIALEYRVRNRGAETLRDKISQVRTHRVRPAPNPARAEPHSCPR